MLIAHISSLCTFSGLAPSRSFRMYAIISCFSPILCSSILYIKTFVCLLTL
nr:MAG TPA_asm: hypothetical protein [Caudoviricetes sp.]